MKIFGREPAAIVGLIEALLAMALTLNMFDLTQERIGLIMAVVTALLGLVTAFLTKDTALGFVIGLIKAVMSLAAGYGLLLLTPNQTGALIALVTVGFGLFQRTQTSALVTPTFANDADAPVIRA